MHAMLLLHEEEAVDLAENAVVLKKSDSRADEYSGAEVEETFRAISKVESVAARQHHPPTRMKARVGDAMAAWADGAGPPVRADGT